MKAAIEKLKAYNSAKGYGTDAGDLLETLKYGSTGLSVISRCNHRWWTDVNCVATVDGTLYGFISAETTGDDSPSDKGWELNVNSIKFVEAYTEAVVVTKYRDIPEEGAAE